jgi:hypothetical protein
MRFVVSPHVPAVGVTHRRARGARPPFTRPCRPFWSAFAELIRGQTSPTDFCNNNRRASNQTRALASSQGGRPRPPSFSIVPRPLPCGSGDTRRAVLRPFAMAPVLVPPACAGLPSRDATSTASPPGIAPAVHSEDRRARVEGPSEGRVTERMRRSLAPATGAYALWRMPTSFPSSGCLRTSAVIGAFAGSGGYRHSLTDRPRPSFRRSPAKSAAFQKTGMPFTVTTAKDDFSREGIAPSGLRAGSLAHAAHTFSPGGESVLDGHCEVTVRSPAGP